MKIFFILLLTATIFFCPYTNAATPDKEKDDNLLSFVAGHYVVVGKKPDDGTAYSGTGTIKRKGDKLILTRKIGTKLITAAGKVDTPHPPGEGRVLRFFWTDKKPKEMTCMVHSDLDNYARLTCLWGLPKNPHQQPGVEAYFSTAAWREFNPTLK